jgi:hypothetical protein
MNMVTRELTRSEFEVLNLIVLKKMCRTATVAEILAIPSTSAVAIVSELERDDLIGRVDDLLLPTDDAEPALVAFAGDAYAALRSDPASEELHARFEKINSKLLHTMHAWQQIDVGGQKVTNDHTDPDYDERIISTVVKLIERLKPIAGALGEHDPRFLRYGQRFDQAVVHIHQGDIEYLSSPVLESAHNIWFEFHEDLLRTLGKARKE